MIKNGISMRQIVLAATLPAFTVAGASAADGTLVLPPYQPAQQTQRGANLTHQ
ncbi:hypothetical protein [Mesorhizobium australafricanum]|uniref:Uncharacterized protein n=1 Tax=Mesorhizobium australafricanum TaxID=3072311 RepID=A0ABU4WXC9_9HYPH|nr:hypothetical protein [Mesorhizobium sp. VK3E]MDX8440714.1 hypothetical protein [Mesorhizobium sp. VK3E]